MASLIRMGAVCFTFNNLPLTRRSAGVAFEKVDEMLPIPEGCWPLYVGTNRSFRFRRTARCTLSRNFFALNNR